MKVTLNGKELTTRNELHRQLREKLGLPDYGDELDNLLDCMVGEVELPLVIQWLNYSDSKKALGSYADQVLEMFKELESELEEFKIQVN